MDFLVSIIELGLGLLLGLALSFTKYDEKSIELIKHLGIYIYYIISTILLYAVIFYFIFRFYTMYRKIAADDNIKKLISTILKNAKSGKAIYCI